MISQQEFIDFDKMDCDTNMNRFKYDNGETKFILDESPNHFSRKNHKIFANILLDFFENGLTNIYSEDLFKKFHLDENSEFMTIKKEFKSELEDFTEYWSKHNKYANKWKKQKADFSNIYGGEAWETFEGKDTLAGRNRICRLTT